MTFRETVLPPNPFNRLPAPFGRLQVSRGNVLEHLLLKRQIGNKTLQAHILALKILHPLRLIDLKPAVFFAPAIITLQRYARIPAGHWRRVSLRHRYFNLAKQRHDLLRTEPLLRHDQLLSKLFSHNAWSKKARSGHDDRTLADTVEGLTDLHEIVTAIIRSALADEALATGLKGRIAEMEDRLGRLQDRASKRRQIAKDVMVELDLKRLTAPDFTASIRPGMPALMVIDEAAVPSIYWEPREPRLNRQGLIADLKQGAEVTGVTLSNPEPVLSVRTR